MKFKKFEVGTSARTRRNSQHLKSQKRRVVPRGASEFLCFATAPHQLLHRGQGSNVPMCEL